MKKIETTNIAGIVKAPYIKVTHDHYVESIKDTTANVVKSLIGTYTTNDLVILYGCEVSATIPGTSSITAGAIYYNGEIYEVDANASLITTGSETLYWEVVTTYAAGDPIVWSDGVSRNLHRIDKLQLVAGTSGGGLADYDASTVKYNNFTDAANGNMGAFSVSNCTLSVDQYNAIRKGDIVDISFRAVMVVTTGASASSVILNIIDGIDFIASTKAIGTFQVRNDTTAAFLSQSIITNGLNATDIFIDSNKRVNIKLDGSLVSNGQTVSWLVQFTAKATV